MQELLTYGPLLALAASLIFAWSGWKNRRKSSAADALEDYASYEEIVQSYTKNLAELSTRITKQENMLIRIRGELQKLMQENEDLKEQLKARDKRIAELEADLQRLKDAN